MIQKEIYQDGLTDEQKSLKVVKNHIIHDVFFILMGVVSAGFG